MKRLVIAVVIIVGCIGSQPVLSTGLTAVPCFMESINLHCERLKQLFNDVAVRVIEVTTEICLSEGSEIPHAISEKLRVSDAVFFFQFREKLFDWIPASMLWSWDVEYNLCINVYRRVQPRFLFIFDLNLFFIDCYAVRFNGEILVVILCILLIPVLDRGSASFNAEPTTEISAFCQRGSPGMGRARQPDQLGWRARPVAVQKLHIRRARYLYLKFFE